jgi:hypothetical protein
MTYEPDKFDIFFIVVMALLLASNSMRDDFVIGSILWIAVAIVNGLRLIPKKKT